MSTQKLNYSHGSIHPHNNRYIMPNKRSYHVYGQTGVLAFQTGSKKTGSPRICFERFHARAVFKQTKVFKYILKKNVVSE